MINNAADDLSSLTNLPKVFFQKDFEILSDCVCDSIVSSIKDGNDYCEYDICIGRLIVAWDKDSVKFKFIPSKQFEFDALKSVSNFCSPLQSKLEKNLKTKILNTYKELL